MYALAANRPLTELALSELPGSHCQRPFSRVLQEDICKHLLLTVTLIFGGRSNQNWLVVDIPPLVTPTKQEYVELEPSAKPAY